MKHIKLFEDFSKENMLYEGTAYKWTPEKIRKAIQEGDYKGRTDLERKNKSLYQAALRKGILDEYFDKYTPGKIRSEKTELTADKIREQIIAGDYKSKKDLRERNSKLYKASLKYGVLYEFFDEPENFPTKWTEKKIREEIIEGEYLSKKDLENKNKSLYNAALYRNMLDEFFVSFKWTPEKIREEIKKGNYKKRSELKEKNYALYQAANKRKMLDEFFSENTDRKWTPEKIREEIKKGDYKNKEDLRIKDWGLYQAAYKYKILDEFFKPFKWTEEKIREEIKKGNYKKRSDLFKKNNSLYQAARRNKMLDEFFGKKEKK